MIGGFFLNLPYTLVTQWLPVIGIDLNLPGFLILCFQILFVIGGIICIPSLFYVAIKETT